MPCVPTTLQKAGAAVMREFLVLQAYRRDGHTPVVSEGQGNVPDLETLRHLESPSGEVQRRPLSRLAADFDLRPRDALLDASSEGLCAGLFCGKAGREALSSTASLALTVGDLLRSEDAGKEAVAEAVDGCGDSINFNHIDSGAHKHECNLNDFVRLGNLGEGDTASKERFSVTSGTVQTYDQAVSGSIALEA